MMQMLIFQEEHELYVGGTGDEAPFSVHSVRRIYIYIYTHLYIYIYIYILYRFIQKLSASRRHYTVRVVFYMCFMLPLGVSGLLAFAG